MTDLPRRFHLQRDTDITGVSGTGRVADGVLWPDGSVALRWRGERPSTVHWDRLADAEHVHGHHGATRIIWDDEIAARHGIVQHDQPVYKLVCSNTDCDSEAWTALAPMSPGDQKAVVEARSYLTDRAERRDQYAAAMARRDGHDWPPQYEDDERDYRRRADAAMAVADVEHAADIAHLRSLLAAENKRANDAITREETAEQAVEEARAGRAADDEPGLLAKVDEATATLRRVRAVTKDWEQRVLPRSEAHRLLGEVRDALAGPRPDHDEAELRRMAAEARGNDKQDDPTVAAERNSLSREADRLRKDWVEMRARAERAEALIAEVRAKHKPRTERHGSGCVQCGIVWPCPTYKELADDASAAVVRAAEPADTEPETNGRTPCRAFVSGGTVWCCEEGETDCPCICHQPAAEAQQDGAQDRG